MDIRGGEHRGHMRRTWMDTKIIMDTWRCHGWTEMEDIMEIEDLMDMEGGHRWTKRWRTSWRQKTSCREVTGGHKR